MTPSDRSTEASLSQRPRPLGFSRELLRVLSGLAATAFLSLCSPAFGSDSPESPPTSGCDASQYTCTLELPYGSRKRGEDLIAAVERRIVLDFDYQAWAATPPAGAPSGAGCEARLAEAPGVQARSIWRRESGSDTTRCLELGFSRHPSGAQEILIYGATLAPGGRSANPDLPSALAFAEGLLRETEEAALGGPSDGWLTYQLNYIQSDRALAILADLGYSVIRYGVKIDPGKDTDFAPHAVQDRIFQADRETRDQPGHRLRRPVIVQMIDSQITSLVGLDGPGGPGGAAGDSTLTGGSPLTGITSGVPEQRLMIVYYKDDLEALETLLNLLKEEIDVPARQILIEALVIELDRDRLRDLGLSFSGANDGSTFSFDDPDAGLPFLATYSKPSPQSIFELNVRLRALVDEGDAQVLSRPSVLVLDGRQARIKIADEIPYLRAKSTNATGGLTTEINFLTAGIILNLRPRATHDGDEITLQVETIISSAGASGVTSEGIPITPTVQSREVQTFVRVANDTPFVIGGLIATTQRTSVTGVPGLSKIPGLGRLFRKESLIDDRKEVAVIITPHVIDVEDREISLIIPKDSDLFDSFDSTLFRNVYRLRSSDIFDLRFIWDNARYRRVREMVEEIAAEIAESSSAKTPATDRELLIGEIDRRLEERFGPTEQEKGEGEPPAAAEGLAPFVGQASYVEEQRKRPAENFLQFLEGGVPGEEILVQRMLAGIIRGPKFDRFLDRVRQIILFSDDGHEGIEITDLADLQAPAECRQAGDDCAMLISFRSRREHGRTFSPPIATVDWEVVPGTAFRDRLRQGNTRDSAGRWTRQTVILRPSAEHPDPLTHLRVALLLKRLLDLNEGRGLLTLRELRAGREVVLPTFDDLQERAHLVDRRAAQLFYEVLDYYWAFEEEFERLSEALEVKVGTLSSP